MKSIICTLSLLATLGFICISAAPRYKYTYGTGINFGFTYNGSRELGVHAKNGTYSVFTNGFVDPNAYGDAGVFINPSEPVGLPLPNKSPSNPSPQQVIPNVPTYNPYQGQGWPQYPQPYYPYPPQYNPYQPGAYPPNVPNYTPQPVNPYQPQPGSNDNPQQGSGTVTSSP